MEFSTVLEVVQFFTDIKDDGDGQDEHHGQHEAAQEFAQYVPIQFSHLLRVFVPI